MVLVRKNASVSLTPQILTRFRIPGINVSPAPRRAPVATIEAANSGSASSSMRSTSAPRRCTSGTGVRNSNTYGQRKYIATPVQVMISTPMSVVSQANDFARSLLLPPTACPTIVVAALAMP